MTYLKNLKKQHLSYLKSETHIEKNIDEITEGPSQDENFLYFRTGEHIKIFDRKCDHNGGRLSLRGGNASCPLHGWELDLKSSTYVNAGRHKMPLLEINEYELDSPLVSIPVVDEILCGTNFDRIKNTKIRFFNHACLLFQLEDEISFATDPWVIGSAFCNGWWLAKNSPKDVFDELNRCDFIYISHNHPDHLHKESMEQIRKDMPILTAYFLSGSTKKMLNDLGFSNVLGMDFNTALIDEKNQLFLSVLKSGDFRDDSGLFVQHGTFKCLLTVDSNFLNFGKFPEVDLLCSSFSGGASGYPLCFENYSEQEKKAVVTRNRRAIRATNTKNIQATKAKYFMPYAGFFSEKAHRDSYIKLRNTKNNVEDFKQVCDCNNCELLNVNEHQLFSFNGSGLEKKEIDDTEKMLSDNVEEYIANSQLNREENLSASVLKYFYGCEFNDNLTVDLIATNDDFSLFVERFILDFDENSYKPISVDVNSDTIEKTVLSNGARYLQIKVRASELFCVLNEGKPWEDLSIGFQCRFYRQPNIYNSEFWFYFTNVYIGSSVVIG